MIFQNFQRRTLFFIIDISGKKNESIKNFQEDTKKDIVKYVTMEIPLIRAGSRFLCGIKTQEDQFNKTGLSPKLIGQMFELVGGFCKMRPDSYETCLIAALCATSPDRGIRNATDYKILSNIQVWVGCNPWEFKVLPKYTVR